MKFMKLGSKPDAFQTEGDNIRYVATELSTDLIVNVVDVKFYLHKFPLLSKSARLQKLVALANEENKDEIFIQDIPGGPAAFEICAKYCYGMTVTLNAYNVVAARCAAEYLEMFETIEKGNLIYKVDVFLNSSIFRGWKDSIIVLQTTTPLQHWAEKLSLVSHCVEAIASKVSMDTSKVEWSYTYNRKKLPSENGQDLQHWNGVRKQQSVPKDWWVEDLCDLDIDLYKRVLSVIRAKGKVSGEVIGEALKAYALRRLPGFNKGMVQGGDPVKNKVLVETIVFLLPGEKGSVSCGFMLRLLRAALVLECGEVVRKELMKRIGWQLEEASVADLLIRSSSYSVEEGSATVYDVEIVQELVKEFVMLEQQQSGGGVGDAQNVILLENGLGEIEKVGGIISEVSKGSVAKLVDCYLAEVSRDPNLPLSRFLCLAELVSGFPRASHDGLYRAIDMYLKEHPDISKSDRKRICRLMDCRKLSADACAHAVQNERLPLRVVVQVLFFEQVRASALGANNGTGTPPELPCAVQSLMMPGGSHGSSRSATTNTEDWDPPTTEELKALRGELANLRMGEGGTTGTSGHRHAAGAAVSNNVSSGSNEAEKAAANRVKGLLMSKRLFSKLWSGKDRGDGESSSDTSESPASTNNNNNNNNNNTNVEERSTPSRSRRRAAS